MIPWPVPGGHLERIGRPPAEIEARSRRLAAAAVAGRWSGADADLAAACVYASGDLGLAEGLILSGSPAAAGAAALRAGRPVLVDVEMVAAGARLLPERPAVGVAATGAAALAGSTGTTRAAAGMRLEWERRGRGGVVAVGNAPTALLAVLDLAGLLGAPACVLATCPGLTLAAEAKALLARSGLPYLAVAGERGGSGLAAAVLNALARLARGPAGGR